MHGTVGGWADGGREREYSAASSGLYLSPAAPNPHISTPVSSRGEGGGEVQEAGVHGKVVSHSPFLSSRGERGRGLRTRGCMEKPSVIRHFIYSRR